MAFKKYCLLENGSIQLCHYQEVDGTIIGPRNIYKEKGEWLMKHDVYAHNTFATCVHKIIAFSDVFSELVKIKERNHL